MCCEAQSFCMSNAPYLLRIICMDHFVYLCNNVLNVIHDCIIAMYDLALYEAGRYTECCMAT